MSDENDSLRRIIERAVEDEHKYLPDESARKVAGRIAEEVIEQMRRAGIKAILINPPRPQGEDC